MAAKTLAVEILTVERGMIKEEVAEGLVVPTSTGEMGILPGHAHLIARLVPGILRLKKNGATSKLVISGGYVEVSPQQVTVLADAVEAPEDIDLQRALAAKERALARLQHRTDSFDIALAQAAMRRAMNRINVAAGGRQYGQREK